MDQKNFWEPKTFHLCQTPGRSLWEGLQALGELFEGLERQPFPYPVNPTCKCERCKCD